MGEQVQQAETKPEEKKEQLEETKEEKQEEKPAEEKKEETKPPSPCVLFVDLHCVGCAKKIQRYIMKMRGVEGVVIDMTKNEVTIKGIVEPQAICNIITKKAKRRANVISPLPAAEGEPIPEVVNSQVSGPVTVELNVNMHCEACAEQLKRKILQMRGVQTALTEFSTGKVLVTGTMDANKLVDYVYRRTKKQAKIVPQPEPEPEKKEENKEAEKPAEEEAKPEEKKEEEKPPEEPKKEEGGEGADKKNENKEEKGGEESKEEAKKEENVVMANIDDEGMKRMMYYYHYPPLYVIERLPPPQLFSDENPNACCIT
ncbi:heavy metal-associated isoprenylated plant protein 9-like isoform X2 [Abrus precatorius]|uniref:Heavy metal-associated isoprenylated plant protein 9-like isoform X2 n=1 Tax=Abrus precatorius TaxID=3816 RepID=A0A8B8JPW0_ABRPR|nr:heavy metal-associated isoprenylated plant protein 9-like isoform X2 [Abrus precatorius]